MKTLSDQSYLYLGESASFISSTHSQPSRFVTLLPYPQFIILFTQCQKAKPSSIRNHCTIGNRNNAACSRAYIFKAYTSQNTPKRASKDF
jgi:hypothetical protein